MSEKQIEVFKKKIEILQSNDSLSLGAQALVKLLSLIGTDADVKKQLNELGTETKAELIAYGKEKGFDFTEEDVDAVGNEIFGASDELSDDDLKQVASGGIVSLGTVVANISAGVKALVVGNTEARTQWGAD